MANKTEAKKLRSESYLTVGYKSGKINFFCRILVLITLFSCLAAFYLSILAKILESVQNYKGVILNRTRLRWDSSMELVNLLLPSICSAT